ncbi:9680_t:CDS:2, partial [Cetraspora pellucida]
MNPILFDNILKESGIKLYNYNDFTILEKIGKSESANVEKARLESLECIVILKILKVKMSLGEHVIREFIVELQTLHEVSEPPHPHIRHFYGVAKDNNKDQYFLVLQYAD